MQHIIFNPISTDLFMNKFLQQHCLSLMQEVFKFEFPAENILAGYFKKNIKIGTKDRQTIGDIIFILLRHFESISSFLAKQNTLENRFFCACALLGVKQNKSIEYDGLASQEQLDLVANYLSFQQDLTQSSLSAQTELPSWLLAKLDFMPQKDLLSFAKTLNQPSMLDVRVNPNKAKRDKVLSQLQQDSFKVEATPFSPWGIRFVEKKVITKYPLYQDGTIEIQDEGSQLLALITMAKRNDLVVDFCAGAGGKSLAMAAMMANTGRIYAMDVSEQRLRNLKPRLERSGFSNITLQQIAHEKDARIKKLIGKADKVLVDAPCSGLGTLQRHPDLKYRQSAENIEKIKQTQYAILTSAASLVKNKGLLIYATCSILPEENEQQVELFLKEHPEFNLVPMHKQLEKCKITLQMDQYLNLMPEKHQTDGFFAAVMVKN